MKLVSNKGSIVEASNHINGHKELTRYMVLVDDKAPGAKTVAPYFVDDDNNLTRYTDYAALYDQQTAQRVADRKRGSKGRHVGLVPCLVRVLPGGEFTEGAEEER